MPSIRPALLLLPLLVLACDTAPDASSELLGDPSEVSPRCIGCNWDPPLGNTHGLNGFDVAALDTEGAMHDGWALLEVLIDHDGNGAADYPVHGIYAEDGLLVGYGENEEVYTGSQFVGSVWTVKLEATKETETLEISAFYEDPDHPRYEMFFGGNEANSETFTCPLDDETGEYSVFVFPDLDVDRTTGTHEWRPNTIYFGCTSGAVGKAALWGYSPWSTSDDVHQTASRMVRADYCGDGTSYTVTGTGLQLSDTLGIRSFEDPGHSTEAFWGPDGAACVGDPRLPGVTYSDVECASRTIPMCETFDTFAAWPETTLWSKTW